MKYRLARRIGAEAAHLFAILLLLIPALYLAFCILSFGKDHSPSAFLSFLHELGRDEEGRLIFPQLWRGLGISFKLIAGSLALSIPFAAAVGWWGSLDARASVLKVLLTVLSSVPAFAFAYVLQRFSNEMFFPILTLAISDLTLSVVAAHVMKEMQQELRRSYVRTAAAKGLRPFRHYWRRLVVEIVGVAKSRIAYLIGGTVVVERIFSLRGLGNMAVLAVKRTPSDVMVLLWICLLSVVLVYILNLCEALLREALMPSPVSDETSPTFRERIAAAWSRLARLAATRARLFRAGRRARPLKASPRGDAPPVPRRRVGPIGKSAFALRLSGFLSASGANRVKFVLGVVLWTAALAAAAGTLLARPLSVTGALGATCTGQDILGATLLAGRRLLLPVLLGAVIPILLGLALGAYAGYFRFSLLSRAIEYAMGFLEAMPKLVLVMIAAVIVETDALYLYKVVPFMGFTFTPLIYDHVRKRVEYLQRMNFVETERALGASPSRILFYHILFNNCRSIVSVHGVHLLGQIVLLDAAFDYLGLAQPEHYTWGALFYNSIYDWFLGAEANPWAFLAPLAAIILSVCALTTLSDGLDAILSPPAQEVT